MKTKSAEIVVILNWLNNMHEFSDIANTKIDDQNICKQ